MNTHPALALLGGTFDPPHLGHISIAQSALQLAPFERCVFIPCHTPVHKEAAIATPKHRLAMLNLALHDQARMDIETSELDSLKPRYTLETLKTLRQKYPQHALTFIMGCDGGRTLTAWHAWQDLLKEAHLLIMPRSQKDLHLNSAITPYLTEDPETLRTERHGAIFILKTHQPLMVSSTHIRSLIAKGDWEAAEPLLNPHVLAYIKENGLYQTT